MGGRYLLSGSQLGSLITLTKIDPEQANKLINEIIEEQHITESTAHLKDDLEVYRKFVRFIENL